MYLGLEGEVKKLLRVTLVESICKFNNEDIDKLCGDRKQIDRLYDEIVNIVQKQHEKTTKKAITTFIDSVVGTCLSVHKILGMLFQAQHPWQNFSTMEDQSNKGKAR